MSVDLREATTDCQALWHEATEAKRIEKVPRELGAVGEIVTCLVAHPGNDLLLLGTATGKVIVWDPTRSALAYAFQAHTKDVTRIVFDPEGRRCVTVSVDGFVHWWDEHFSRQQGISAGSPLFCAALSPNGQELAAGGQDRRLRIWNVTTGSLLHTLEGQPDSIAACVWLSKDVVVTAGAEGHVRAWEVNARRCVRQHRGHQAHVSQILRGAGEQWYLSASWDQTIKVWNQYHREKFAFPSGTQAVTGITLSPDLRLIAAAYWDGSLRIWNVETGKLIDGFAAHEECLIGCAILADGKTLVTADQDGRLRAWPMEEMGVVRFVNRHAGEIYSVRYTPDNLTAASVAHDGQVRVWERGEGQGGRLFDPRLGPLTAMAISPDNQTWALGGADGSIRLWNNHDQVLDANIPGHRQAVSDLAFLPRGDFLVSASWDMKLRLWSMETQAAVCTFDGHTGAVAACDVSLDGRTLASASWDGTARLWDLTNRRRDAGCEKRMLAGHDERVLCCAFHPDGESVATGSADQTVRVWPVEKRTDPRILFGHPAPVTAVRYTPDGRLILSADREGHVFGWDAIEGRPLFMLDHESPILALAIAPDGAQAAIGDEGGSVRFMDLNYPRGPKWIAASLTLKTPPLWKRGAPPLEQYDVACLHCGAEETLKTPVLGEHWRCRACGQVARLCPKPLPPQS